MVQLYKKVLETTCNSLNLKVLINKTSLFPIKNNKEKKNKRLQFNNKQRTYNKKYFSKANSLDKKKSQNRQITKKARLLYTLLCNQ